MRFWLPVLVGVLYAAPSAADPIEVGELRLDRPTLHSIGLQLLIAGDDDGDASASVRYRESGASEWREGPALFRVLPETVSVAVPAQLAGSLFELDPGTTYEIEVDVVDPDGGDQVLTIEAATRPVPPAEPGNLRLVEVADADGLREALAVAEPGDVIELADGTYAGSFSISPSGTAGDPIVIRGASPEGVVLDGGDCSGCNVLEVYGSHVHVESLTITGAVRALRFQGEGATGNVARRLIIRDVVHGIGSRADQTDFVLCDNHIEGRLVWPWVLEPDATSHWDDRGIEISGTGHVVCHNRLIGFGDPILNMTEQARSWDAYGNDIYDVFDGIELDRAEGNVRVYGNRWTNVMAGVSIQPAHGGPVYVMRNVLHNVGDEQVKLKSVGGDIEPSGALVYHNTFISPDLALNLQTPITQHNFVVAGNLFVGPEALTGARTVDWTASIDRGTFDGNGYYPDGGFWFGRVDGVNRVYDSFAEAVAAGEVEAAGVLLAAPVFEDGVVGPVDVAVAQEPPGFVPAPGSGAIDAALSLPGLNHRFLGAGPDIGAIEAGCPAPHYGPRPPGMEAYVAPLGCSADDPDPPGTPDAGPGGPGVDDDDGAGDAGGCGCQGTAGAGTGALALLLALGLGALRRRGTTGRP